MPVPRRRTPGQTKADKVRVIGAALPELGDREAVADAFTSGQLANLLKEAGEAWSGNKNQLVTRFVRHATRGGIEQELHEADLKDLTALQLAHELQERGIAPEMLSAKEQRQALREFLRSRRNERAREDAENDEEKEEELEQNDSSDPSESQESELEEEMQEEEAGAGTAMQERAVPRAHQIQPNQRREGPMVRVMRQLGAQVNKLSTRLEQLEQGEKRNVQRNQARGAWAERQCSSGSDSEEKDEARPRRRQNKTRQVIRRRVQLSSGSEEEDEKRPRKAKKGDGATDLAAAIVNAIEAIGGGEADGERSASASAGAAKIEATRPAEVDLRKHRNDSYRLGLLLKRATMGSFEDKGGMEMIGWRTTVDQRTSLIHGLVHTGATREEYAEGEALFFEHITWLLTLATEHATADRYRRARSKQQAAWPVVWADHKKWLRQATKHMTGGDKALRMEMEILMTAAMACGHTPAQITKLNTAYKLRSSLAFAEGSGVTPGGGGRVRALAPPISDGGREGRTDGRLGREGGKDGPGRRCGEHMPNAVSVIGEGIPGAQGIKLLCNNCGKGGSDATGHRGFECPVRFHRESGRCMPGFDAAGTRVPGAWNGNKITEATKEQWRQMQGQGLFRQPPKTGDQASMPDLRA